MNQKKTARLNGVIAKYAAMAGERTIKGQAERILIDRACYSRRLENPGLFTLDELEKVSRAFGIPWTEIAEALG